MNIYEDPEGFKPTYKWVGWGFIPLCLYFWMLILAISSSFNIIYEEKSVSTYYNETAENLYVNIDNP